MTQLVPNVFFPSLVPVPASQLDDNFGYVSGKRVSVKDAAFGAKGDGVTDDTVAINAAITYATTNGAMVWFPLGTYLITSVLSISSPVFLVGSAMGIDAYQTLPAFAGTTIKYVGVATASPVITFSSMQGGGMRNLRINANSLADYGLKVDTVTYTEWDTIEIQGPVKQCLWITAGGTACAWNRYYNFALDLNSATGVSAMHITTVSGVANPCHSTFIGFRINHGGASNPNGLDLGCSDNCLFQNFYISRTSGNGKGVNVIPTELAGFPGGHVFVHLEAGAGGWFQPVGTTQPQIIIGYNQSGAVVTNNTPLVLIDQNGVYNVMAVGDIDNSTFDQSTVFRAFKTGIGQIICGFQGTSSHFYDADAHNFRTGAGVAKITFNSNVISLTSGGFVQNNSLQVLGGRNTGWTAGTGTPNKGAFNTATATATDCAQRILALEQAMFSGTGHGLIGT